MDRDLTICTDLGSSLGKGCYYIDNNLHWIAQDNAVEGEKIRDLTADSCVVEYKDRAWTVGSSAGNGIYETNIHQQKAEQASLRALGMFENEKFTEGYIDLTVLLPQGERQHFKTLESNLEKGVYGSTFNGIKPNVKLRRVREMSAALPELSTPEFTGYKNRSTDSYLLIKGGTHDH